MIDGRTRVRMCCVCGFLALVMLIDRSSFGADLLRHVTLLEKCVRERPAEGTYLDLRSITGFVLNAYLLLASILANRRFAVPGLEVRVDVPWSSAIAWFQAWYFPVALLRVWDGDFTCGRHANGISGHIIFYVYYALLFWRHVDHHLVTDVPLGISDRGKLAVVLKVVLEVLRLCYTAGASAVLFSTYTNGFHSLRQLVLGMFFCIIFVNSVVMWCQHFALSQQTGSTPRDKQHASRHASLRLRRILWFLGTNAFCILCLLILCFMDMRPTEYRELFLYAIAICFAVFYPSI